ncbi:MAG: hypothetical protein IKT74_08565 [Bacteroidales bacterium]|nr:hypothetical protein [Bacteroidales bacterium]
MDVNERIEYLMDEIYKELLHSMNYLIAKLKHEFKITTNNLPFLPLYVYFRKNALEQILQLGYSNGDLNEDSLKDLEEYGIVYNKKFKKFNFKSLREFEVNNEHCSLDLQALKEYFWTIESWLLGKSQSDLIYNLYFPLTVEQKIAPKLPMNQDLDEEVYSKEETPSEEDIFIELANDIKDFETLKESNWIIYKESDFEDVYCLQDELFYAYYEARKELFYPDIQKTWDNKTEDKNSNNRKDILRSIITADKLAYYLKFLNDRIATLRDPQYNVPDEIVITILENTFNGLRKVRIYQQIYNYTQFSDRLFTATDLRESLGCAKEKYAKYTSRFGEFCFTDEELESALEKMNLRSDLFMRVDIGL